MIRKMFEQYSRVVPNGLKRERLYKKYRSKVAAQILFVVFSLAFIIETFAMADAIIAENGTAMAVYALTMILWIVSVVWAIIAVVRFRAAYSAALNAPPEEGEMPEISAYRGKVADEKRATLKKTGWALALLIAGVVVFLALLVTDVIRDPESEDIGTLTWIGIVVFAVTLFVYMMARSFAQNKRAAEGETLEQKVSDDLKAIDETEGREHPYKLDEDKNLTSFKYIFPTPELYAEVSALSAKRQKKAGIAVIVSGAVGLVLAFTLLTGWILDVNLAGLIFPVLVTIIFASAVLAGLKETLRMVKTEKRQKALLESDPALALNYEIYKKYDEFSKIKGKILYISVILSIVVGFVLGGVLPGAPWSLLSIIILLAGVYLNNFFVKKLRKDCIPLEREIDIKAASAPETAPETDPETAPEADGGTGKTEL